MSLINLTLKDVPEICVLAVTQASAVVVDRHYKNTLEVPSEDALDESYRKKDEFREKNGLPKKWNPDLEVNETKKDK